MGLAAFTFTDRVRPVVELGVGDSRSILGSVWDVGRWDAAYWSGLDPEWLDITCDTRSASTFYGRQATTDRFIPGTATVVVDNSTGWADPTTDDPYGPPTVAVPGYLTPTVGTVSTPDPVPLPDQCTFVFKFRLDDLIADSTLAGQWTGLNWLAIASGDTFTFYASTSGAGAELNVSAYQAIGPPGTEQMIAVRIHQSAGTMTMSRSIDNGATWQQIAIRTGAPFTVYHSSHPIMIGTREGSYFWRGRIYSVELRTGLDPAAGTVVWRFDASDYPGTGTIYTDPRGRTWTLTNAAAITPKVMGGPRPLLSVRPGRPIRISIDHAVHGRRILFRGFVDAMTPAYTPADIDTVELSCLDALGEINRAKLKPAPAPVGAGETASDRAARILDAAGWLPRDIQPSSETLLETDLGGQVADMLGQTADSAGGAVFGDHKGQVAFRPRDWQTYLPGTPVDGTIGNVESGDVCPVAWERPFNRADITTRAIVGRDLATAIVVDDATGIGRYGIEPFERTGLLTLRDESLTMLANRVMRTRGDPTAPRVRSVTLDAATSTEALDLMSTVDVYRPSRYRCRLQYPPPRGLVFDDEYFATGAAHDLTPTSWTLALNLDVAAPYAAAGGRWDAAYWNLSTWTGAAP